MQSDADASPEPRWPALLAIAATTLSYMALPKTLEIGPRWLLLVLVVALEVPAMMLHRRGKTHWNQVLGFTVSGLLTAFVALSLSLLIIALPKHTQTPVSMLRSAAALWCSNVLVFSIWYWRLDAGGPAARDAQPGHTTGAFLFPQMLWEPTKGKWSPQFLDYLFLAFNTSTAISPTDTAVLSRWAKVLVMLQSLLSLTIVVILAARAVNIM